LKSWAHTYMAGSLLGTVLIVAALVAFVPLVSLKAPDEWQAPGLGLVVGAAKSDVGVGAAVVAAAKHPEAGGLSSNPAGGPSAGAATAVPASGLELHTRQPGGAESGGPANGTVVAISPASIEVARNPASPTSEGAGAAVPLPNPPETGSAPTSTATEGEVVDVGKPGETPSTPPINAGVDPEGPESQPPEELPESVPPPPSGSSTEGEDGTECPEESDEGEAAQIEDGNAPVDPGLNSE
jgi:hypothetical protein